MQSLHVCKDRHDQWLCSRSICTETCEHMTKSRCVCVWGGVVFLCSPASQFSLKQPDIMRKTLSLSLFLTFSLSLSVLLSCTSHFSLFSSQFFTTHHLIPLLFLSSVFSICLFTSQPSGDQSHFCSANSAFITQELHCKKSLLWTGQQIWACENSEKKTFLPLDCRKVIYSWHKSLV